MRWLKFAFLVVAFGAGLPGCGAGGPAPGMATDIPDGPPPLPPGTSKEMTKASGKTVHRPPV